VITEAVTDAERRAVQGLFETCFAGIGPTAVPMTKDDDSYAPIVAKYLDDQGKLIGAALTCRAPLAVTTVTAAAMGLPETGYRSVLDKHSELDLMAVVPDARGKGVGGELVQYLEARLRDRGVRVWFGNATADLEVDRLREFYMGHGFTVLADGQPLPPLLGKDRWSMPMAEQPAFYFYKHLAKAQ
jgi:GNAT superfamily N-acetyltransferase